MAGWGRKTKYNILKSLGGGHKLQIQGRWKCRKRDWDGPYKHITIIFLTVVELCFFLYRVSNPVVLPFKVSESFWNHFKMILLDQEMDFLKNPVEKKYFFLSKNDFEKTFRKKNWFSEFPPNVVMCPVQEKS